MIFLTYKICIKRFSVTALFLLLHDYYFTEKEEKQRLPPNTLSIFLRVHDHLQGRRLACCFQLLSDRIRSSNNNLLILPNLDFCY
jgi:hypothetical protein